MQVLITGSREATAEMRQKAREVVDWCITEEHTIVVGDAPGIDHAVRKACWQSDYGLVLVYGAYGRYREEFLKGRLTRCDFPNYPARDRAMAQVADLCIAIWNGTSSGTKITYEAALDLGKRVRRCTFQDGRWESIWLGGK